MYYFIFLSLAALGLHCSKGFSLVVALQFLAAAASPVKEHRLSDTQASVVAACGKLGFFFFFLTTFLPNLKYSPPQTG